MSNQNNSSSENIKCVVRCRPLNAKEKGLGAKCITISPDSKVVIVENKDDKNQTNKGQYAMDKVFDENITQVELFQEIGEPILKNFIGGYNCTLFCYGQTGAGKTHTMMGPLDQLFEDDSPSHGLIPRIIHYLFNEKEKVHNIITNNTTEKCKNIKYQVKTCVMEIYQEQIIDLLNPLSNSKNDKKETPELKIKEDPKKGMYIQGITEAEVLNAKEAKTLILTGLKSRHVAATEMNAESSRSHLLFSIYLNAQYIDAKGGEVKKSSRLHLIDLAGSERQKKTKAIGERIKEACMINKSLSTLGNVINALVEQVEGKGKYIPFRDSKLTYFLKDSLGGNSKTTIVANISCSLMQVGETISTLKFVQRAKMIKNSVSLNVSVQENIETLHAEIKKLKEIIAKGGICDLSLLDGEGKKDDYICPICHNKPIEITQEQAMGALKTDIINLTEAIVKNFAVGDELKKQFMTLDTEFGKNGIKFFDLVDQYKNEYEKQLNNLGGQVKLLNDFYDEAKEGMEEANKKINEYKPSDPMDRLTFEKVNNLNNTTAEIVKRFKECDIEQFNKLQRENQALKKEIEISSEVKKILEDKEKNKSKEKLSEKERIISDCVDKFVKSNDDIKKFMSEHFLGQPMLKNELVFLEKSKYDLLLFQLDEEKMTNDSLRKQIEDMESENYLINMELSKMKNQLDNFKNFKSLGRLSIIKGNLNNKQLSRLNASKSIKRLSTKKLGPIDEDKINNGDNNTTNNSTTNLGIVTSNFETENKKNTNANSISNKLASEIIKMKESLEDLNEDLEDKIFENEELQGKILELEEEINKLNIQIENEIRNNSELKEQIESLYTENELYEQQIFDLIDFKKQTGLQMEEFCNSLNNQFSSNKDLDLLIKEIFELYHNKCHELFKKNQEYYIIQDEQNKTIKNLNNKLEKYKTFLDEINNIMNEITELCNNNNDKTNSLFDIYKSEITKIIKFYNLNLESNNKEINEILDLCNINKENINNINDLYQNDIKNIKTFYNNILDKNNKEINEIINFSDKNNNNIINLFGNYNNEILKIKNFYNMNIDKNNNIINDIIKLCDENNIKVNNLFEQYKSEIKKIIKFYNLNLDKNKIEINAIMKSCEENNKNVTKLLEIFKNEMNSIVKFYNITLYENNNEINKAIQLCDNNKKMINNLHEIYLKDMENIQKFYNNIYLNSNNITLKNLDEINNILKEQINNLNDNESKINILTKEMKDTINILLVKLNFKEQTIIKLNKEIITLKEEKTNSDNKNNSIINELKDDVNKYKNKLFKKDNIIKMHLDYQISIIASIDEISQLLSNNETILLKLEQKYNNDLSKFYQYYNNIILYQNKNIINKMNNSEKGIDEIKILIKNNENVVDDLLKMFKELSDKYFDKCCILLNSISNQDVEKKLLENKILILEDKNKNLEIEKKQIEEENLSLMNEKKNIENLNQLNNENINKLKINLDKNKTQITNLNEEILKYIEQLKIKDDLINNIKSEKSKLNFQLKEYQNEKINLNNNLENKNELINSLQNNINKNNLILESYNKKNIDLLKEIKEEKNKNTSLKKEIEEKDNKINELNDKISKLFNEISNKDKIINQYNLEQIEWSKNLNEINESKNILLNKINEKETEILNLQKNNNDINSNILNINEQNNTLLNECQNKSKEIDKLNEDIKNKNILLESKEQIILKLNKILKNQKKQALLIDYKKNNNKYLISQSPDFFMINSGKFEFFDYEYEINSLKEINNNLYLEHLEEKDNENRLNMKYNITKVLTNLNTELINEFKEYKIKKGKDNLSIEELIDIYIKEKNEKCNEELKNTKNNINQKINEKKKINGKLLNEIKNYNDIIMIKYNQFISNLNLIIKIVNEIEESFKNEENKTIIQIIKELLNEINQYNIFKANIEKTNDDNNKLININESKEIIAKIKNHIQNKKEVINNIIPKIIDSYKLIIKIELKVDNEIKYYQYKKQKLTDKKLTNDDLDKFINEYNNLKNNILSLKDKYNKIKEDFLLTKEKFLYNENIFFSQIEKELKELFNFEEINNKEENKINNNLDIFPEQAYNEGEEEDEDSKKIKTEMIQIKNDIFNKKTKLLEISEKENNIYNKYKVIYNDCKNEELNLSEQEKKINQLLESRENIEKKLNELKINNLILTTLPNQYNIYKIFISYNTLEEKNKKLEEKLKLVFCNNFNCNYIYNDSKPEITWSQEEIPQLESEIMILREEKNSIENDLKTLKSTLELTLNGNDNHLTILLKIKEENKKLKKEIQQIKEKNIKLEDKLKELNYNEMLNNNKYNKINDFIGINNSLNGNSILSINDMGNNINNNNNNIYNNKVIKEYKKSNIKQKLLFSDSKFNSSFLNGSKENGSDCKSKSKKINK